MRTIKMLLGATLGLLLLAGCNNLAVQPKLANPYAESPNFDTAARLLDEGAVPVGHLNEDTGFYTGSNDGIIGEGYITELPIEITQDVLLRGQSQYEAFCTPCHGYAGYGNGVLSLEGLRSSDSYEYNAPASYHDAELVNAPVGRLYQAIAYGVGNMYSYSSRVQPEDRWAIVAYIRALQLSQNASVADVPAEVQAELDGME